MYRRLFVLLFVSAIGIGWLPTAVFSQLLEAAKPDLVVIGPPQLLTPLPVGATQPVSFAVTIQNIGTMAVDAPFFIDIFLDPSPIFSGHIPINQSGGFATLAHLPAGSVTTVTIPALAGFNWQPPPHTVYAVVDSLSHISEADEQNNLSVPLIVTDVQPILADLQLAGPVMGWPGQPYTFTAVISPTDLLDPIAYSWLIDGTAVFSQSNGTHVDASFNWPATGSYSLTVIASASFNSLSQTVSVHITDTTVADLAVMSPLQNTPAGWLQPTDPVTFSVRIQNVGNMPITQSVKATLSNTPNFTATAVAEHSLPTLAVGETMFIQFALPDGVGPGPLQRTFYAFVDPAQAVTEADETNNMSAPLSLTVGWQRYLPLMRRP